MTASRITMSWVLSWATAMSLLQGDHAVAQIVPGNLMVAMLRSHETDIP